MNLVSEPSSFAGALSASLADDQAAANCASNLHALASSQPRLLDALRAVKPNVTWIFARDKSLTCLDDQQRWWAGCSVPAGAAKLQLKSLRPVGSVACFIEPPHAGHVRAALSIFDESHAVICVMRDLVSLRVMLACDDFSNELSSGRLWFAWGENWEDELAQLFDDQPGLPTPGQFIRLNVISESVSNTVINAGQKVFAEVMKRRADEIHSLRESCDATASSRPSRARVMVAAPLRFRLWNDAGYVLADTMRAAGSQVFDVDDPRSASPVAIARAASNCDAIVAPDVGRAHMPGVVAKSVRWITWVTKPNIPQANSDAPGDALLLADENWRAMALACGWQCQQIHVAGWPTAQSGDARSRGKHLAMIADTSSLETPKNRMDFSSHAVLWERLREELLANPLLLGDDINPFLDRRMAEMEISAEGFDRNFIIEKLILPAYQQGLAKILIDAAIPLHLFGKGWNELPRFAPMWRGEVNSREALIQAATSSAGTVRCWPAAAAHPIDAFARPVMRCASTRKESVVRDAKIILSGDVARVAARSPLSADLISQILRSL